ncbi:Polyketide cyclase / dehydrase and lipid transport [Paenibacillaceae bacterium GAS479]|nr:Polyketide cyclase / dehydrase and lipid transport [Paenibacillaceae bacterium GAS479]
MAHTAATIEIPASPDEVWQLIGGFNSLPDWLPYISSSELTQGGRVRRLVNPKGDVIMERLEEFNNKERFYTYSITEAPFPATEYQATIRIREIAGSETSLVEWSGSFTPVGVSDEEVIALFHGIYKNGLEALRQAFLG